MEPCNPVPVSFQHANEDVERMLLGNKCDMEDKRVVPKAKGEQVSVKQKLLYPSQQIPAETSACTGMPQWDVPGNEHGSWIYRWVVGPGNVLSETAMNGMSSAAVSASFGDSKFTDIPEVPHRVTLCGVRPLTPRHRPGII